MNRTLRPYTFVVHITLETAGQDPGDLTDDLEALLNEGIRSQDLTTVVTHPERVIDVRCVQVGSPEALDRPRLVPADIAAERRPS
jgi:hypothetical protein